jgi:hypothetical protein
MTGYQVTFSYPFPGGTEVHRIRNWAEDVARQLQTAQLGDVPDMDSATTHVTVRALKRSHLSKALAVIRLSLRRHNLSDYATVVRSDAAP